MLESQTQSVQQKIGTVLGNVYDKVSNINHELVVKTAVTGVALIGYALYEHFFHHGLNLTELLKTVSMLPIACSLIRKKHITEVNKI